MAQVPPQDDAIRMNLANAVGLARQGQMAQAVTLARDGLKFARDEVSAAPTHAFLGMVLARTGDREGAVQHLQKAHRSVPDDVTVACNLVALLVELERPEDALLVATERLAEKDQSRRIARYRGFLAQNRSLFDEAIKAYRLVTAAFPDDFESLNNLGNALSATERYDEAIEVLKRAVDIRASAPVRLNLAGALIEAGRKGEAREVLARIVADFPDDPNPHHDLFHLAKERGDQAAALAHLEKAAALKPQDAEMQMALGVEYGVERRIADAEAAYRKAISLKPEFADAYLGLAIQFEHTNREDMFAPLAEEGRANDIGHDAIAFIEALELRRKKEFGEALERIEAVSPETEPVRAAHIKATLLDRLGRTDEAFAAYTAANSLMETVPTAPLERAEELRRELREEIGLIDAAWADSWTEVTIEDGWSDPVFLVGFPRSGTTLLDTLLMGHADTVVMEEQPPLNTVERELGGLTALASLDLDQIARARARYFEEVEKIQPVGPGQTLVDKSPLFLYRLPLIKRLFPKAKIILALRHPCDVVLSCFMSNFRLNSAMASFLRLEDAAEFYDLCFTHWVKSREVFDADVFSIRYESLVADVEAEVRPLVEWLDLEWDEQLLDHSKTARSRGLITTASYSQVTEPIYKRASGRWLRYRKHLEPIIPRLDPWAEAHGYGKVR